MKLKDAYRLATFRPSRLSASRACGDAGTDHPAAPPAVSKRRTHRHGQHVTPGDRRPLLLSVPCFLPVRSVLYVLKRGLLQRGSRATRVASRGAPRVLRLLTHHFARARFNLVFLTDALSGSLGPKAPPEPVCQAPCERAPVTFAR